MANHVTWQLTGPVIDCDQGGDPAKLAETAAAFFFVRLQCVARPGIGNALANGTFRSLFFLLAIVLNRCGGQKPQRNGNPTVTQW